MSALGGRDIQSESPSIAAKYAAIYRSSQRELLILAHQHIVQKMNELVQRVKLISANNELRPISKRKRTKSEDDDENMTNWICRRIKGFKNPENYPEMVASDDNIKQYLECLIKTFYERIDWAEFDNLNGDIELQEYISFLKEELEEEGLQITWKTVRIAWEIWNCERTEILMVPDARECFARFPEGGEELQEALSGVQADEVILKDELVDPGLDVHWDPRDLIEMEETHGE